MTEQRPRVVLICHEEDRLDSEGLASWLANTMDLRGVVAIRDDGKRLWRAARREVRRVGWLRFLDVVAFRLYARLALARRDSAWKEQELTKLTARFPADLDRVPHFVAGNPNADIVRDFLVACRPDLVIARCKFILKPSIFQVPSAGSFALHPGICPEYRNAHGCFWALVNRDMDHVGMTLLKLDEGIDTGPVYLQAGCPVDEVAESHTVIQYRVVTENLDAIGQCLIDVAGGAATPLTTAGRQSATWGQPRLTDYLGWKWTARRSRRDTNGLVALP